MHKKTLAELARDLKARKVSSEELTRAFLARIERYNPTLNAFISVLTESALVEARAADQILAAGKGGPLTGLPIVHKDIFCTEGVKTSCGSKMLDNFIAPYDATVVARLKQAGTVLLGKANMDEFAMGSSNETSYYGPVKNPWDVKCVPGGSSGGSAAAVAARLTPAATGTDTGGSIRQPAALVGLTGLKPTYGCVSRYGIIAFASSLDQAGVITYTAEDTALLMQVIAGYDERDSTSVDRPVPDYTAALAQPVKGLRIGVPKEFFDKGLDPRVAEAVQAAIGVYKKLGAEIKEISLPNFWLSVPTYYVVAPAECSSNLARFDGVRFGYRCQDPIDLTDLYMRSRGEGFGDEVKRRIMTGTYVLSSGYYDAYYIKAQKTRALIRQDFLDAFGKVDVIMGPTSPSPAFALGEKTDDPVTMYLNDIYANGVNLAGLPGLSIPAGFAGHLPVGLQIIGNYFDEARLLAMGHQYQRETDWHTRIPKGFE
ncbi:MAG TPA: Asp-tRNA(Asn)/Glu-tRNA(Gln) amidotransferase subunit GatA [Gammaproteobacteria bacterium]|jgi:aspartyl-tRNA(Asn)/glutamyl-tRNA(Gln) amidotransferase subunit A|nr:Asp-tRNA(Asn)/Glu-tRNA(Gln) amidotransferase subunit GatA [Gammaproteobacteria bacterium]